MTAEEEFRAAAFCGYMLARFEAGGMWNSLTVSDEAVLNAIVQYGDEASAAEALIADVYPSHARPEFAGMCDGFSFEGSAVGVVPTGYMSACVRTSRHIMYRYRPEAFRMRVACRCRASSAVGIECRHAAAPRIGWTAGSFFLWPPSKALEPAADFRDFPYMFASEAFGAELFHGSRALASGYNLMLAPSKEEYERMMAAEAERVAEKEKAFSRASAGEPGT